MGTPLSDKYHLLDTDKLFFNEFAQSIDKECEECGQKHFWFGWTLHGCGNEECSLYASDEADFFFDKGLTEEQYKKLKDDKERRNT